MRILVVVALILAIHAAVFGQADQSKTSFGASGPMQQGHAGALPVQNERVPADIQESKKQPSTSEKSQPAEIAPQVPSYVTYQLFFIHLESLDQVAAQVEAKGQAGAGWRTHEQRAAGLSDEEGKILKQVAYDCNHAIVDLDEKANSVAAAFRAQHPNGELFASPPPELASLQDQRIAAVNSCLTDLEVKLGTDSFKKLDDYIQTKFTTVSQPASSSNGNRPGGSR